MKPHRRASGEQTIGVPRYLSAALLASLCVIVGVMWDISWHSTIGRDTFWTPAHMAIYAGGLIAGLSCGWLVLATTFGGAASRGDTVRFWRVFHAPLGAWVCIWGTFAMLTSAPFDNWWHNAYGLDVQILSPPHTVLALGIAAIQLGALLMTLALQNRAGAAAAQRYRVLYAAAAGLLFLNATIMTTEYHRRVLMHTPQFYVVACLVFPFYLVTLARASRLRWPTTSIAAVYTVVMLAMVWLLPLFPATPRLGPIYQTVTHMVPPDFPLLLLAPAFVLDLMFQRVPDTLRGWRLAALLGTVFFAVFFAAQWSFGSFYNSPASENWVFASTNYYYALPKTSYAYRHIFPPVRPAKLAGGLALAAGLAVLSSRLGLACGDWLRRVKR
ncbi:MAG TPA: hypothetical protein VFW04_06290 [Gemmatimonadaceae bacterium]|nr:hypothetical protein [Gemmatimonadaceae bacterium]